MCHTPTVWHERFESSVDILGRNATTSFTNDVALLVRCKFLPLHIVAR